MSVGAFSLHFDSTECYFLTSDCSL